MRRLMIAPFLAACDSLPSAVSCHLLRLMQRPSPPANNQGSVRVREMLLEDAVIE